MELRPRAVERGEEHTQTDIRAAALRAALGGRPDGPAFETLLSRDEVEPRGGLVGIWRNDAHFHLYVPDRAEAHVVAWRTQPGRRANFSEPVALADLRGDAAWRATLLPPAGMAARPAPVSGLAVVDGDGLQARYEFTWSKGASGWRADDAPDRPSFGETKENQRGPISLDPVSPILRGMWTESCGRCLRYALSRQPGTPHLALCRRDCLSTFSAF
ncbi:MAG: hypothetical protein JNL71_01160 [Rhodospirillales bacterium]|nr:hypothetical protein [Rhodospirillales bacterium]